MTTTYNDSMCGEYRLGDTVEFLGYDYSDIEYGQRGIIDGFDETSIPSRPILVSFDSSGLRVACSAQHLDVIYGAGS